LVDIDLWFLNCGPLLLVELVPLTREFRLLLLETLIGSAGLGETDSLLVSLCFAASLQGFESKTVFAHGLFHPVDLSKSWFGGKT
jgi:hypothetical protein